MKKLAVIMALILVFLSFAACGKSKTEENTTESTTESTTDYEFASESETETTTESTTKSEPTSKPAGNDTTGTTKAMEPTEEGKAVTYISEDPNNYYICRVADQFGSDKANLIAFIMTNASTDGATVLEFSGAKDANGNLITTSEELKYLYDVPKNGDIKRASRDDKNNLRYNKIAAKAVLYLADKYMIPSIDEMREKRRYEDYFNN